MRKLWWVAAVLVVAWAYDRIEPPGVTNPSLAGLAAADTAADNAALRSARAARADGVQLQGSGRVVALLPDDNEGSRHQRFIVEVEPGFTVLLAHNIDLAPRVARVATGDRVSFYGEYVWNEKGGVVHWTHHDPAGRHVGGWIQREGRKYQ